MNYYAHGGLANAAQHLAQKGRNGDTQLIHVSPKELHGLQALAAANGTSLTINPHTGLPEAFNFKKLIPMVAGAALTATGIGAPAAALMVGGAYAAGTGSIQKGLMAGIGAYGGAGLGAGLAEAGVSNLVEAGGQEAVKNATAQQITEEAAKDQIVKSSLENQTMDASRGMFEGASRDAITSQQIAQTQAQNAINSQAFPNYSAEGIAGLKNAAANAANPMDVVRSAGMGNVANSAQVVNPTIGQSVSNMGNGIGQLGSSAGRSAVYSALPTGTLPALGATALDASQKERASVPGYQEDEYDRRLKGYKLSPDYQAYTAPTPNPYYRPVYAAIGGIMNSDSPHSFDDESGSDNVGMATGGMNMAGGGIAGLGGYSDGGRMLKGPGDGMSDSIPGVIGGKQPARLADGEFVVPADVVSHLGNGSTDAGAKKLYGMMDKIRQARTGKKKQAPQINVDKYLPMSKAFGGITGYASGGIVGYAEGGTTNEAVINQIYQDQLGRTPDPGGLKFWSDALANGQSVADVTRGINQSLEGQNFDTQYITSLYRQNLDRNPEQEGFQFWLSAAQQAGYTPAEIQRQIVESAKAKEQVDRGIVGQTFTNLQSNALEADPYAGRYVTKSIYDLLPDAVNVSTIGNQKAQFVNPVTQKSVVSNFGNGAYSATNGQSILNEPQVQAAITVARNNGTLSTDNYNSLIADLNAAKTPEQTRLALAKPQANVVIDALYGQQIGENANLATAQAEAEKRQAVLTKQDPGYYQSNPVLSKAYQDAGLTVPFDYGVYKNVDTRNGQANLFTPENFQQKKNDLQKTLTTYKPTYPTLNRNTGLPASVRDPYSNEGLQYLYGKMMDQYGPPPEGFVNPGILPPNTSRNYTPYLNDFAQKEAANRATYDAKVAADRLAYDKAGINESNFDAKAYLKANPDAANPAIWSGTPYAHYVEANRLGDTRTATKLPFVPTPYTPLSNNLVLNTPIPDASKPVVDTTVKGKFADTGGGGGGSGDGGGGGGSGDGGGGGGGGGDGGGGDGGGGDRAGGLLAIDRKKRRAA